MARREPHGLCASSVINCVHDALSQVFSEIVPGNTAYVDSLVSYAHETGSPIYTTNFDSLIEEACARLGISPDLPGTVSPVQVGLSGSGFKLYKLHGSLDWDPLPLIDDKMKDGYVVRYRRGCSLRGSQNVDLDVRGKLGRVSLMLPHLNSLVRDWTNGVELVLVGSGLSDSHLAAAIISRLHVPGYSIAVVNNCPELPLRLHYSYPQIVKAVGGEGSVVTHDLSAEAYCLSLRHNLTSTITDCIRSGGLTPSE